MNDYQEYLENLHTARPVTPDKIVINTIKEATGSGISAKRRIIAGEVSEVYDIGLENGKNVVLRISRRTTERSTIFRLKSSAFTHSC